MIEFTCRVVILGTVHSFDSIVTLFVRYKEEQRDQDIELMGNMSVDGIARKIGANPSAKRPHSKGWLWRRLLQIRHILADLSKSM